MKIQDLGKSFASAAAAAALAWALSPQSAQAQPADQSTYWGDILYQHVANDGGGGFNFHNGPVLGGNWDDFADFGDLAFTANFNNGVSFNTLPSWNGVSTIQPFGLPAGGNTATYGQTFFGPQGATKLLSYTFYITDSLNNAGPSDGVAGLPYQGIVTPWNATAGNGMFGGADHPAPTSLLFVSPVASYTGDGNFEAITINIPDGGLSVTPGDAYFMGLSSLANGSLLPPTGPGSAVPDAGSSMLMLSASLGGIAALRRRFSKN